MYRLFGLSILCLVLAFAASEASAAIENPAKHAGEQSGLPLSYYCTHVPDLSVKRSDAVDDWLSICALYFSWPQAQIPPSEAPGARADQPSSNLPGPPKP